MPAHELAKVAGDPADDHVLAQVRAAMQRELEVGAADAAEHLITGENAWFADQGLTWTALQKKELLAAYQQSFADVGGFKDIADSATAPIQGILTDYYADPQMGLPTLTDALSGYFSGYKAVQVGITETTRMSASNADLVAQRVDAENWEWDSSNDAIVCSLCAALDGQSFALSSDQDSPPEHVGCRCSKAILIEDAPEDDTPDVAGPDDDA